MSHWHICIFREKKLKNSDDFFCSEVRLKGESSIERYWCSFYPTNDTKPNFHIFHQQQYLVWVHGEIIYTTHAILGFYVTSHV